MWTLPARTRRSQAKGEQCEQLCRWLTRRTLVRHANTTATPEEIELDEYTPITNGQPGQSSTKNKYWLKHQGKNISQTEIPRLNIFVCLVLIYPKLALSLPKEHGLMKRPRQCLSFFRWMPQMENISGHFEISHYRNLIFSYFYGGEIKKLQ